MIRVFPILWAFACSSHTPESTETPTPSPSPSGATEVGPPAACALDAGPFSLTIDNPYLPLAVGAVTVLEAPDGSEKVQVTVLDETEDVGGVATRVVEEREWEDGVLIEVSRNYFAQAPDGSVCYFGEAVDVYEDGQVADHPGAWRADTAGNAAGIVMPGSPAKGARFLEESAPGIALDTGEITAMGAEEVVTAGTYADTVTVIETSPLDAGSSRKVYARGVGMIVDAPVQLTSVTIP